MNRENDPEEVTEKEKKLITLIRCTKSGRLRITMHEGEPLWVEEVRKLVKL